MEQVRGFMADPNRFCTTEVKEANRSIDVNFKVVLLYMVWRKASLNLTKMMVLAKRERIEMQSTTVDRTRQRSV